MNDFTSNDLDSLAGKLDALDLNDAERAALDAVFDAAINSDADVSGFYANQEVSYFRVRLGSVLFFDESDAVRRYIGETEKNISQ